jgi:hypothetical protein
MLDCELYALDGLKPSDLNYSDTALTGHPKKMEEVGAWILAMVECRLQHSKKG